MENENRKFKWKYLIIWAVMGAVVGLVVVIGHPTVRLTLGESLLAIFFVMPLGSIISAGMGILFDAWAVHNWRFGNIEHRPWVWYIYPVVAYLHVTVLFFTGFFLNMITGGNSRK